MSSVFLADRFESVSRLFILPPRFPLRLQKSYATCFERTDRTINETETENAFSLLGTFAAWKAVFQIEKQTISHNMHHSFLSPSTFR